MTFNLGLSNQGFANILNSIFKEDMTTPVEPKEVWKERTKNSPKRLKSTPDGEHNG